MGNDPEGTGLALATGIMVQNIPEGLAVAVALAAFGAARGRAVWLSSLTGLVEVVAGLVGLAAAGISAALLAAAPTGPSPPPDRQGCLSRRRAGRR